MPRPNAFTLIELLVVITIIVILLALLTPALDRAIYQAEITVCGTQQKGIATGAQMYAVDYKRRYPHRAMWESGNKDWRPNNLKRAESQPELDDRIRLRPYISIDHLLNDVLAPEKLVFEAGESNSNMEASFNMWFGFGYVGESAMRKLGDRFGRTVDHDEDGQATTFRFAFLTSDLDAFNFTGPAGSAGHQDFDGVLQPITLQDGSGIPLTAETDVLQWTYSRWENNSTRERGLMDTNASVEDGSVQRYTDVAWDEADATNRTPRMIRAPVFSSGYPFGDWDLHIGL